ncbi:hypothetical protein ACGF7W_19670 [Streptomyces sp. NPDC048219]|uniref:hypothetical protein n=1 Tax=Streptomyces sp. NPDC048219 TaxID=3365517 RepID=UPI0037137DDC
MSTPYERLMAEGVPTGTFGYALPPRPREGRPIPGWTPEEQGQHLADLLAALVGWQATDERAERKRGRHLRLIHDHDQDQDQTDHTERRSA